MNLPLLLLLTAASLSHALDNGLARTPPLGWSTWNYFATQINETLLVEMADAMVHTGLAKAGFEYINVDAGKDRSCCERPRWQASDITHSTYLLGSCRS
jgi:hypothetical protein